MGAQVTKWSEIPESPGLQRLTSSDSLEEDDPVWNSLFSVSVKRPATKRDWLQFDEAILPMVKKLAENNKSSRNLCVLIDVLLVRQSELSAALESENSLFCWQMLNCIFLLRATLKGLQEICGSEEEFISQFQGRKRCESLMQALGQNIINPQQGDIAYSLKHESLLTLITMTSAPLFGRSSLMLQLFMSATSEMAPRLSDSLIHNFTEQAMPPVDLYEPGSKNGGGSFVVSLASGLLNFLTLGYSAPIESGLPENEVPSTTPLADESVLFLLCLVHTNPTEENRYCQHILSLDTTKTKSVENEANGNVTTTSNGHTSSSTKVEFSKLFTTLYKSTRKPEGTLLMYTMLHRNTAFRNYVLASSDIDMLVLPILKNLYEASNFTNQHTYMSLIVLLILTEDELFNGHVHENMINDVSWYCERILGEISLGGLIILVIIRTIQHNMLKMRDKYLHTNCLAALANMSSQFKNLHTYVCQRIVSLFEALAKKYCRVIAALAEQKDSGDPDEATIEELSCDLYALEEVMRMVLEIINSSLVSQMKNNSNLIYTLLYEQAIFKPFERHPTFSDLLSNISMVIQYFNKHLETLKSAEGDLSVPHMQQLIKHKSSMFPFANLQKFPDLRFKYVEEEKPEDFFIPYVWSMINDKTFLSQSSEIS